MENLKFLMYRLSLLIGINYTRVAAPWPIFNCKPDRDYYQLFNHCLPDHPDSLIKEGSNFYFHVLSKLLRLLLPFSYRNDVIETDIDIV